MQVILEDEDEGDISGRAGAVGVIVYAGRPLVEEFKRGMNGRIRRKLMELENPPTSIEQWYRRATALDRNWRESKREEERLRKKEVGGGGQK